MAKETKPSRVRTPQLLKKQLELLKAERYNWEGHWQELADYMYPRKNSITSKVTPGSKRNSRIFDNTGPQSGELLAGALHGMLTNPASLWFELTTGEKDIDEMDEVRKWLQDSAMRMHMGLNRSNFQTEVHELYSDLVFLGTSAQTVLEDDEVDFRFMTYQIGEIYVKENNKGLIDEVFRVFEWEASKIIQEFGEENCPEEVIKAANDNDEKFEILHVTYPNTYKEKGINLPFCSKYVLLAKDMFLRVKGFNEDPWLTPRWSKASGEVYGRGPGMTALAEVRTINLMTETMIRGAQKTIDPPMQAPDDGFVMPIRTKPGSINYYRSGSGNKDRIQPIFNDLRIDFGFPILDSHRQRIKDAFYVNQLFMQEGPQKTATEVNQRSQENFRFLGPMIGRMESEYLTKMIDRVFGIMFRKKRFAAIPEILKGKKLAVRYSSPIAKMQRMGESDNIFRTLQAIQPFAAIDQTIVDNFDADKAVRGIATMNSFPQEYIRDKDEIEGIRQARAKAQAEARKQQEEAHTASLIGQAAPGAAQMAKAGMLKGEEEEIA